MKEVAAYALLVLGGNSSPTVKQIETLLKISGTTSTRSRIDLLVKEA